jgi:hypothetical protein
VAEQERRLDRITADGYVDGLADRNDAALHAMKAEAEEVETEVSYVRRVAQGRLDIVTAQRESRAAGRGGLDDLVARLPEILARDLRAPQAQARVQHNLAPDPQVEFIRDLEPVIGDDSLVRLPEMSDVELDELTDRLQQLERDMSAKRRRLHEVIDAIDAEIGRRAAASAGA